MIRSLKGKAITDRQAEWLGHFLECGNASEASRRIGITKSTASYGQEMKRILGPYIQANMQRWIANCAPAALEQVFDIACNCPDPKIRLAAAIDILNRAGYKEAQKIEISTKDKSDDDLNREIDMLLGKGGIVEAEIV